MNAQPAAPGTGKASHNPRARQQAVPLTIVPAEPIARPTALPQAAAVLNWIFKNGPASRAEISTGLDLSRSTLVPTLADLQARGLLRATGTSSAGLGRPATVMAVDGGRVAGLGASINDGELSVVATTLDDHAIGAHRERFARHAAPSAVLARLAQLLAALANQVREAGSEPIGVTVAQDGRWCAHLDPTELDRMLAGLSDSTGASGWPISSSLLPRSVATATAESRHANVGDHHAQDALVLMTGRDPRGLVLKNGRLVLGAQGLAGAVDHLPVGQGLLECDCGLSGCWKPVVSPVALGPAAARHDRSVVAKIRTRALAGDADAHAAIERVGYWLGVGSAVIAQFVRPEHIVIAGVYAPLGPFMRDALLAGLSSSTAGPALEDIDVTISSLGEGAAARGAALHAVEQVLTHPELTPYQPVQDTADL